ncbi:magnesium protoporphyrin IX methyltransferase [Halovulum dunhuangense]|uniref:Magnesium protoporphyrin IX methyltransferase n=1 Tax=Halovulum dunhuangense TaxID=1505036 RepID=A0A849KR78_9RHOB|nr:magnesium protoporphyrin IX methyltransferase [Halovulum dunhuangense]NNU79369.1 magnesium protoporphyrin IX methyltransferase [Halovulum dunhuangense]
MPETYDATRGRLEAYFDGTANEAWKRLMSDAPVSRIRQTVRAGRDRMRAALLAQLPADLHGARVLDAGCGAGQLSVELAARGAEVVGADISPRLLELADSRTPEGLRGRITYRAGDMLDPGLGRFHYVVAMDSLIHYAVDDIAAALARLAPRVDHGFAFTVAPRTPALSAMHLAGKLFPRSDRSPAIQPVGTPALAKAVAARAPLSDWMLAPGVRVSSGFYISQAMELRPA